MAELAVLIDLTRPILEGIQNRANALEVGRTEAATYTDIRTSVRNEKKRTAGLYRAEKKLENLPAIGAVATINIGVPNAVAGLAAAVRALIAGGAGVVAGTIVAGHAENAADTGWQLKCQTIPDWPWADPRGGQRIEAGSIPGLAHNARHLNAALNTLSSALQREGYV